MIGFRARLLRRDIDGDHVLAALEQRFQDGLTERLLAVHHNTHLDLLHTPIGFPLLMLLEHEERENFYSAAAFFRAAVAPASLRPAISSAE